MKLDEFISSVLTDIDIGLKQAKGKTNRNYHVDIHEYRGVTFDIAVTTANSSENQIEGEAKADIINVIDAKIGTNIEDKKENSQVSRIQFSVYVPDRTEKEIKSEIRRFKLIQAKQAREKAKQQAT